MMFGEVEWEQNQKTADGIRWNRHEQQAGFFYSLVCKTLNHFLLG